MEESRNLYRPSLKMKMRGGKITQADIHPDKHLRGILEV